MRHALTTRFTVVATAVIVAAAVLFAVLANATDANGETRTEVILSLEPQVEEGRDIFTDVAQPACASCHTLAAADAQADGGPSLDDLEPSAEVTIRALVGGTVAAHDEQGYEHTLSNQQIADLAAYIERSAG